MAANKVKTIFISSLEHSAELHCANLIRVVGGRQSAAAVRWVGFGGDEMVDAGCTLLGQTVGMAAMLYNVFSQLGRYRRLIRTAGQFFRHSRPDLVIVCDSPAFNFHIAKAAKKLNIPVLFYVAPQLWAWAPWRIGKLRKCCDRLACILPFERDWFVARGVKAEFVGNPLLDNLAGPLIAKNYDSYDPDQAKIALLPGSRNAEIRTLWLPMQEIARRIQSKFAGAKFLAVAADNEKLSMLKSSQINGLDVLYRVGRLNEAAAGCDFALVASGSATLQVAAAGCPMIVMYQSNKVLWNLVGRWLIRIKHLSLVNILAGRQIVPEFMPCFGSVEPIAHKSLQILADREILAETGKALIEMVKPMANGSAAENVANIVIEMLNIA